MKFCIISPCGSEDDYIVGHIDRLRASLSELSEHLFEIVFVVDNYTSEKTMDLLREAVASEGTTIRILEKPSTLQGLAGCYIAGYEYFASSDSDYVIEMDVGHPCDSIQLFVKGA